MRSDGSGLERLTNHLATEDHPVFSPDGTQIAFNSNRENENSDVYVVNTDGSNVRQLTNERSNESVEPGCWSPDGTRIAFTSDRDDNDDIFITGAEVYQTVLIVSDEAAILQSPSYSPDGKQIAFEARLDDRSAELRIFCRRPARGSTQSRATAAGCRGSRYRPSRRAASRPSRARMRSSRLPSRPRFPFPSAPPPVNRWERPAGPEVSAFSVTPARCSRLLTSTASTACFFFSEGVGKGWFLADTTCPGRNEAASARSPRAALMDAPTMTRARPSQAVVTARSTIVSMSCPHSSSSVSRYPVFRLLRTQRTALTRISYPAARSPGGRRGRFGRFLAGRRRSARGPPFNRP